MKTYAYVQGKVHAVEQRDTEKDGVKRTYKTIALLQQGNPDLVKMSCNMTSPLPLEGQEIEAQVYVDQYRDQQYRVTCVGYELIKQNTVK